MQIVPFGTNHNLQPGLAILSISNLPFGFFSLSLRANGSKSTCETLVSYDLADWCFVSMHFAHEILHGKTHFISTLFVTAIPTHMDRSSISFFGIIYHVRPLLIWVSFGLCVVIFALSPGAIGSEPVYTVYKGFVPGPCTLLAVERYAGVLYHMLVGRQQSLFLLYGRWGDGRFIRVYKGCKW